MRVVEARVLSLHNDPEAFYRSRLLPDKVSMDLAYVRTPQTGWNDLLILVKTLALPGILAWQRLSDGGRASRKKVALAGVGVMAIAVLPLIFSLGLGSPR